MSDDFEIVVHGAAFNNEPLFEVEEGMYSVAMLEAMLDEFKQLREAYLSGGFDSK